MNSNFRNNSGYYDPTAGKAISHIEHENAIRKIEERKTEIRSRKKVYVVSAFSDNPQVNTWKAVQYCKYVISKSAIPFASHLLYPQLLEEKDPDQRELGLQFGLSFLILCDEVWVFNTNRELSSGMREEIKFARILKKVVKYYDTKELKLWQTI